MSKKISIFLAVFIALSCALFSVGCATQQQEKAQGPAQEQAADKKLTIVTSFYPMYDFTKKLVGDKAEVINLVPAGSEPHDWEPTPQDMKTIMNADLLVVNGAHMEDWLEDAVKTLGDKMPKVVKASDGIELLKGHDDHEDADHHDKDAHDEHEGHEGHHHHNHETDPHVWLSPLNAKMEMRNILAALIDVESHKENIKTYEENFDTYAKQFDDLDKQFKEELAKVSHREIIASHEAFGYLCKDYNLSQVGIEDISADSEPDAQHIKEIIDVVKAHKISTIFTEELIDPKIAKSIADQTGAQVEQLNTLEGLTDEEMQQGLEYFSVQKKNLEALVKALS